jgi:RNA polymerase sigma-70 factor, ECF subfamily
MASPNIAVPELSAFPTTTFAQVSSMEDVLSQRGRSFYRSAYRVLGNSADAEDAVQDALLSAYKHLDQFRGQSQMSTWLSSIVINAAKMQLRRRPRQMHVSVDEPVGETQELSLLERLACDGPSPEEECRNFEFRARLNNSLRQLSATLRETFQLRELDGLTTRETARILAVPDGTVKARLARARAKLRKLMLHTATARPRSASRAPKSSGQWVA